MIAPVLGMHRSGTSALAGVLHRLGIHMGESRHMKPVPAVENPRGFHENFLFRDLNDKVLRKSGYVVKDWGTEVGEILPTDGQRRKAAKLVRKYRDRFGAWGWKDPRTCLTLPFWLEAIAAEGGSGDCRPVFIYRHPDSVAGSMVKRGNVGHETGLRLWTLYNRTALATLDGRGIECPYVRYEELCAEPLRTTAALMDALDLPEPSEEVVKDSIDRGLNRNPADAAAPEVAAEVRDAVDRLLAVLDDRAGTTTCE